MWGTLWVNRGGIGGYCPSLWIVLHSNQHESSTIRMQITPNLGDKACLYELYTTKPNKPTSLILRPKSSYASAAFYTLNVFADWKTYLTFKQWRSQTDNLVMLWKYFCVHMHADCKNNQFLKKWIEQWWFEICAAWQIVGLASLLHLQ